MTDYQAAYDFFGGMKANQARDARRKKQRFESVVPHGIDATKSSYPGQHPTRLSAQETAERLSSRGKAVRNDDEYRRGLEERRRYELGDAKPPAKVAPANVAGPLASGIAAHNRVTNPLGLRRPRTVTTTSRSSARMVDEWKKQQRDQRKEAWEKRKEEQAASRKKKHENRMEGMTRYLAEMESRRKVTRAKVRPRRRLTGTEYNRNRRQHDPGPLRSL